MSSFLREFVLSPSRTGAVAPSSRHLAHEMIAASNIDRAATVIEMGAGTGVFTERIAAALPAGARFFSLEINETFAAMARRRCPGVTIHNDSAAHARRYLDQLGESHCDLIVSSLPWASFSGTLQDDILDTVLDCLRPGGRMVTFAYLQGLALPAGQRFRRKLERRFSRVGRTRTVWLNIPPAFIYYVDK